MSEFVSGLVQPEDLERVSAGGLGRVPNCGAMTTVGGGNVWSAASQNGLRATVIIPPPDTLYHAQASTPY